MENLINYIELRPEILVFKTNINTKERVYRAGLVLSNMLFISDWSFDLEDIDNVLRIVVNDMDSEQSVRQQLNDHGFFCEELTS